MKKITQTAGRASLGGFAPDFAHFNDDILFGEDRNITGIDHKTRCIITVVAPVSSGIIDSSLSYHLQNAKNAGVTRKEIAAILTHTAFYAGCPKAWGAFNQAKEIWAPETEAHDAKAAHAASMIFPIGAPNNAYEKYFIGNSYLAPVSMSQVDISNVTFEPKCRNNWHIHHAASGVGQILICVGGRGYYQEWGKEAVEMNPGDVINIPAGVKHWHGAAPDSWFSHLAVEVPGENISSEWLEAVDESVYAVLK
ncbi:MAG: carboxymuconolactone decarboxylase family protein [Clostridia bacterium]|nr:carboxymuconolactone decarboxylase family protein [Clostridia bacterium]